MPQEPTVDVLGHPYVTETIELQPDDEGPVVATLVVRRSEQPTARAVLHVHGFADYFFHTEYAEWWTSRGYDFYAIDLRKFGRSLRPHQTPNYVADLREYFPELDEAWRRIIERDGHEQVVASGHSTGGLVLPLWINDRQPNRLVGVVLNSPWFDLQGSLLMRTAGTMVLKQLGARRPRQEIKRTVDGFYGRSLHRDHEGEWDFDLAWKPMQSWPIYFGWLRAVRNGHAELHAGLEIDCPVLVLSSSASHQPAEMDDDVHRRDIVLDVAQIRRWSSAVGPHVTYVAIQDARHDVVLSLPAPRAASYDVLGRWLGAFVDVSPDPPASR